MNSDTPKNVGYIPPRIRRGHVDSLSLYEITDYELDILASGSTAAIYLNLAIFFLTTATAFLISLLTSTVESRVFVVFTVMVVVGYGSGIILLVLWLRNLRSLSAIVKKIKSRIPPEDRDGQ